ncbi:MAG: S-adenosylmethionine decarboxylase [Candidatus Adlerbacteria bacterium]|nr:S-adenosylmethionine decarboxylase [Candidatus Adlerbacteria bacterium]
MAASLFSTADRPERDHLWGFYNCRDLLLLKSGRAIARSLKEYLQNAGIPTLAGAHHKFTDGGEGVTAVQIIGASCADVHTWPEFGTVVVRCFACGDKDKEVQKFLASMLSKFRPQDPYEIPDRNIPTSLPDAIPPNWRPLQVPKFADLKQNGTGTHA